MTGRCGTCAHWSEGAQASLYPSADPELGNCERIGDQNSVLVREVGDGPGEKTSLAFANNGDGLVSSWLETRADFGCVLWTAR